MTKTVEVYADITCPFTHVGLKQIVRHLGETENPVDVIVRAWPLEWVNGSPLAVDAVKVNAAALTEQLGVDDFSGLRADHWPSSTIPALNLVASAYERDPVVGLAVSLELRAALFEHGIDVGDPDVLAFIAANHHLPPPPTEGGADVHRDYEVGKSRGVLGSPHFFIGDDGFFCPSLDIGHDTDGKLTAQFDSEGLDEFFARIDD